MKRVPRRGERPGGLGAAPGSTGGIPGWADATHPAVAPREEAAQWAAGRGDLAILTAEEGHRIGRLLVSRLLGQVG